MAGPLRIDFPDTFYHVLSRGNESWEIFRDKIRDSEVAFAELTKNWTGSERDRALKFISWIMAMLSEIGIEKDKQA